MKTILLFITLFLYSYCSIAQEDDLIQNISLETVKFIAAEENTENLDTISINIIEDFSNYLKIIGKADKLNSHKGAIKLGFTGNEAENNSLYVVQSGVEYKSGIYPLNVEANINIQTQIENGNFNEVVSNIDLSVDYTGEKTIHEGYAFIKRTRNTFLGINQRYEIGGGYIVNLYKSPMKEGQKIIQQLEEWNKEYGADKLADIEYFKHLQKTFGEKEITALFTENLKHRNVAKMKYSRYRFAFLVGINSEIEQTQENLSLYGNDSILTNSFKGTNIFRLVVAPKFELRGEKFHWSNTFYGKLRISGDSDQFVDNSALINSLDNLRESNLDDFWIQIQSNFTFKVSKSLSLITSINYIYDNAPKRQFYTTDNINFFLASAEQRYLGTSMTLKYSF